MDHIHHSQKQQRQFLQHQIYQFRHQQLHEMLKWRGDLKVRGGPLPAPSKKENALDINTLHLSQD
ncbi:hypothetical protein LguiB_027213 [Lonicera macranthoides]